MDTGSRLSIAAVIFLLLTAMYFATAETAFSSVQRSKLRVLADRGGKKAARALGVLDNFEQAITTILIGTNIVHISTATIVTVFVEKHWGLSFVALSTVITTVAVFFAGEMLPKTFAKKYSERMALATAGSLCFFMSVFGPLARLLTAIGIWASKLTKGDPEVSVTEDELYDIIEDMTDEGSLDSEQGELVSSALQFADVTAGTVLTARVDVAGIDVGWDGKEVLDFIKEQRHSRLPVYEGTIDRVIGVLQIRRYIKEYVKKGAIPELRPLLDKPFFVHQSMKIDELLTIMSAKRINMAIVTDNYGGMLGIVTVEDILEELVGEIWDEDDEVEESFIPLGGGRFDVDASMTVGEACDRLGVELSKDDEELEHKLLSEWAYEQFDRIPDEKDSFFHDGAEITVSEMRQNRIVRLVIRLPLTQDGEGGAEQ